jgi:hypothetical protein
MPQITFLSCSGILMLLSTEVSGQGLLNHAIKKQNSYYQQPQKEWAFKKLPQTNGHQESNTTSFLQMSEVPHSYSKQHVKKGTVLHTKDISDQQLPYLQHYLSNERFQYNSWSKQRWWKDPSQAPFSNFIRGVVASPNRIE